MLFTRLMASPHVPGASQRAAWARGIGGGGISGGPETRPRAFWGFLGILDRKGGLNLTKHVGFFTDFRHLIIK